MSAAGRRPALPALTGVRFWAALTVVVLHGKHLLSAPDWTARWFSAGQLAVSLFFVLSGLILTYTYARPSDTPGTVTPGNVMPSTVMQGTRRAFWRARFARIYPVYALGLLLDLPFFLSWFHGEASRTALASLVLSPLMLQAWLPQTACVWNCPGWSLSAEAFFYLMFPLLLPVVLGWQARHGWRTPALLLWLAGVLPMLLVLSTLPRPLPAESLRVDLLYYGPLFRLPEFMLGMLLGATFLTLRETPPEGRARAWVWSGVLGTLALVGLGTVWGNSVRNVLTVPALALLVWGLAHVRTGFLSGPVMRYLGEISYSVYILHVPVLALLLRLRERAGLWETLSGGIWFALYVGAVVGLSALAYRFVEVPARAWLRAR